ncbi:MAG: hypothetical protein BM485_04010 [Desulfobulbaceae bacterium DB1]|nr:MAG: hypothetical protein BM485_04010 [Desulfobulbaceae bacterium DB1]
MACRNKTFSALLPSFFLLLAAAGLTGFFAAGIETKYFFFYGLGFVLPSASWYCIVLAKAVREARETVALRRLAAIPEDNPNMILEVDTQGAITFANRACRRRFAHPPNGGLHPLLRGVPDKLDDLPGGTEAAYHDELEIAGSVYERRLRYVPENGLLRVYAVEITDLKKGERDLLEARKQTEEVVRLKSAFLANMGHEIRTPLNAIIGYTELLLMDCREDKDRKRLAIVNQAGNNLLRLINDILDFSKIEAGRLPLVKEEFDPHQLVDAITLNFFRHAETKRLDFHVIVADSMPERLIGDTKRIKQILVSLLSNAFKFTEKGSVTLSCGYEEGAFIGRVVDTGIGISAEQQRIIFAEFQQGDTADSRKYGGAGLGLSITKRLVTLMGGDVLLESEPGRGSCFTIRLPVPVVEAEAAAPETKKDEMAGVETLRAALTSTGVNLRVLVAEDDEVNQGLLKALLRQVGLEAEVAANGREALDRLGEKDFDLLFLDMNMPVLDGMATIAEIRRRGEWRNLHVVALTGEPMPQDAEKFLAAGCDDYLAKPVELEIFYGKIYALLVRRFSLDTEEKAALPTAKRSEVKGALLRMSRELRYRLLQALDVLHNNRKIFNPDQIRGLAASFADFDDQEEILHLQDELQWIAATFDDEALPRIIGKIEAWSNQ